MILPFSTELTGNKTYFPEKILAGLRNRHDVKYIKPLHERVTPIENFIAEAHDRFLPIYEINRLVLSTCKPKLHSMRVDENNRWQAGNKIDFFINNRSKKMLRFAPTVKCISTQTIEIIFNDEDKVYQFSIDDKFVGVAFKDKIKKRFRFNEAVEQIAHNDGFESVEAFLNYFKDGFIGKIIHWTDLKY